MNSDTVSKVRTMHTFLEKIRNLSPVQEGYTRFYRGQRADWPLVPQLYRSNVSYCKYESQIFYKVTAELPGEFYDSKTIFDHLVKMQHYSIPTRLLDITTNPLIALFFACEPDDYKPKKGRRPEGTVDFRPYVYVLDIPNDSVKQRDSDSVTVLSALAKYDGELTEEEYGKSLEKNGLFKDGRLLHIIREDKPYFKDMIQAKTLSSVFCVQPKLDNPRIIRQSGAFLIFGIDQTRSKVVSLDNSTINVMKIEIDRRSKERIRKDLESVSISSSSLFFDLDHLASRIKELYAK